MWLVSSAVYWASLAVVGYTYAGYPLHATNVDSLDGATGAFYVIRRKLSRMLPEDSLVDDSFTLQIALRGYREVFPFALAGLLASNVVLVLTFAPGWPIYVLSLAGQMVAYALALRGALAGERAGKLARVSHTFAVLNLAAVEGLRRFLVADPTWTGVGPRTRR